MLTILPTSLGCMSATVSLCKGIHWSPALGQQIQLVVLSCGLQPASTWRCKATCLHAHRHGYLAELPAREYLPMFWTCEERALLQGTERAGAPEEDARLMREDFEEAVLPLVARYPGRLSPGAFTLQGFHAAASWVASRAFGVDSFHGGGPLVVWPSAPWITCRRLGGWEFACRAVPTSTP